MKTIKKSKVNHVPKVLPKLTSNELIQIKGGDSQGIPTPIVDDEFD